MQSAAEAKQLFVAVALVQRLSPLYAALCSMMNVEGACFSHSSWRFFAGPPQRYQNCGNAWMLDPVISGGGCLINLAPHFIDLVHWLHGPSHDGVVSRLSNTLHGAAVEDYAMLYMTCTEGRSGLVETGYCFPAHPAKRGYSFTLVSPSHYVRSSDDGICIYRSADGSTQSLPMELDADPLYGLFVARVLDDVLNGRAPLAGLGDLAAAMEVVDAARRGA